MLDAGFFVVCCLLFVVCRCLLLGGVWDVEFSLLEAVFLKYVLLHVVLRVLAGRNGDVMFRTSAIWVLNARVY